MAEEEIATKAPESDAQLSSEPKQPSMISENDTPAQKGASMGEHCVTDRPTPADEPQPSGEIIKIADIEVYIAKPSDYPHLPSKLLFLLTNARGIHSKNNQLQADKFASEGFLVVMPDQFGGDALPNAPTSAAGEEEENSSVIEKLKVGVAHTVANTAKAFKLDMWLARQTPEKVVPILHKVVEGAREEFADAVANGGGIYGVGYCFGAKYVCLFAAEGQEKAAKEQEVKDEEKGLAKIAPLFKAGALAHGTLITKEDLEGIKSPISMACVENDQLFPDEIREAGKTFLEHNKIEHEIKIYAGVPHGFAVVGQYEDTKIQTAQAEAYEQMVTWLKSH